MPISYKILVTGLEKSKAHEHMGNLLDEFGDSIFHKEVTLHCVKRDDGYFIGLMSAGDQDIGAIAKMFLAHLFNPTVATQVPN